MGIKENTRVKWQVRETESPNYFIVVYKQVGTEKVNQKRESSQTIINVKNTVKTREI